MDPVVTGGLIGIGGTLLGVLSQEAIAGWRERERNKRLRLRAVSAVEGELLNTVSVLDKALQRGAWWPEGDEPRSDEWQRYRDVLADEFDEEILTRGTIVYNTIRSLAATCSSPLTPVSRGRLKRMLRDDPHGRSFFSLIWTDDRWPTAADETRQTRDEATAFLTECLRPLHDRLRRRSRKLIARSSTHRRSSGRE